MVWNSYSSYLFRENNVFRYDSEKVGRNPSSSRTYDLPISSSDDPSVSCRRIVGVRRILIREVADRSMMRSLVRFLLWKLRSFSVVYSRFSRRLECDLSHARVAVAMPSTVRILETHSVRKALIIGRNWSSRSVNPSVLSN